MNNLKTKVDVTCSDKNSATPYNGKIVSKIGEIIINGTVKIDVKYYDESDNFLTRSWLELDETKSNVIIDLISQEVTENHKLEMINTFGISDTDIEQL